MAKEGNGFVSSCERSVVRALAGLSQPGVDDPPLGRCVLVIGERQLGNDVNHTAGYLELHFLTALEPGTPPNAAGTTSSDLLDTTTPIVDKLPPRLTQFTLHRDGRLVKHRRKRSSAADNT
jgi:hypothetical protein